MKRFALKIIGLALVMTMALLSGCGQNVTEVTEEVESVQKEVSTKKAEKEEPVEEAKEFDISLDKMVENLNASFKKKGLATLTDIKKLDKIDEKGSTSYVYTYGEGFSIILYGNKESGNLTQIFLMVDTSKATKETLNAFGYTNAILVSGFEPNQKYEIDEMLQLNNVTENKTTFAEGENCLLSYIVNDGILMFNLLPL